MLVIHSFFLSDLTKTIKLNTLKVQQGNISVHFSMAEGKNSCMTKVVPVHISGTTVNTYG